MNKEDYKFLKENMSSIIAAGIYLLACWLMYYTHYKVYGRAVDSFITYMVIVPPLSIMFNATIEPKPEKKKCGKKLSPIMSNILSTALIILGTAFIIYDLYLNIYNARLWMIAGCIVFAGITCALKAEKRRGVPFVVTVIYAALIASLLLYIALFNPCSVKRAESLIAAEGYTDINYSYNIETSDILDLQRNTIAAEIKKDYDSLGFYMFSGTKGGEKYAFFVSVAKGYIYAVCPLADNDVLEYMLDREKPFR